MIVSISKKLAKESKVQISNVSTEEVGFYSSVMDTEGGLILVLIRPGSFYSYVSGIKDTQKLDSVIEGLLNRVNLTYVLTTDKSIITKVATIGKKYKQVIERMIADGVESIDISETEKIVNGIPWKFLDSRSPAEVYEG